MPRTVHIIGAGLAGLSAAIELARAGEHVVLYEAATQAGGRCRSYDDPVLGMRIDNGNHIILSGNRSTLSYLATVGAADTVSGPPSAHFLFVDQRSRARWKLDLGTGLLPWWIFSRSRRVPGTRARDYLACAALLFGSGRSRVGDLISCEGALYDRLLEPLLLASLNHAPCAASARLAARLIVETNGFGGSKCRPLVARDGLSASFVEPALAYLRERGTSIRFGHRLRRAAFEGERVGALDFGSEQVSLSEKDAAIIAVPPETAARLVPEISAPVGSSAIANIHFRVADQGALPPMTAVLHGVSQWIFTFPERIAVTISHANNLLDMPRKQLAETVWNEVAALAELPNPLPPWQIVRERRATFATIPEEVRRRPATETRWRNLFLAGDWTATGLPPTIESAVRSGRRAAERASA